MGRSTMRDCEREWALDAAVFLIPHVGQQGSQSLDARGRGIRSVNGSLLNFYIFILLIYHHFNAGDRMRPV